MDTAIRLASVRRRAAEAAIWGVPYVNYRRMLDAAEEAGVSGPNQILYWSGLLDWRNQTLTPNPDVIYLMPFIDTANGPVVLEIPAAGAGAINGSVMNCWQAAIEEVGPAGVDAGAGGKYLIMPPGHDEPLPAGYIPMQSETFEVYALLRSLLNDGGPEQIDAAVEYGRRVRLYPLGGDPEDTIMVDAAGQLVDARLPWDVSFFAYLADLVQREPWLNRDRVMIDQLATLGIRKGEPFDPEPAVVDALEAGLRDAREWLDASYEDVIRPFTDAGRWGLPADPAIVQATGSGFTDDDLYPVDARGLSYTIAFFSSRHLGHGQYYMMTTRDAHGDPLDGGAAYELTVPPDAPVTGYWSVTVYNRSTHTFLDNAPRLGRSSQSPELERNDDGSVTITFGPVQNPDLPGNWIPTTPGVGFEVMVRFYGPTEALFNKSWKLPDLTRKQLA